MMDRCKENVIEWVENDDFAYCTFSQRRYITKIRNMAEKHPEKVTILKENEDGSLYCKIPVTAVKVSIITREKKLDIDLNEDDDV